MNDKTANKDTGSATAEAVERGVDITEAVRDITMQALSKGQLDTDKIREVIRSVITGADQGAEKREGSDAASSVREALSGIDEALANSAQATRLAIEEAAGQVGKFGNTEFKRALADLGALEELFLATVKEAAASSETRVKQTLNDFVDHAKISGTEVGKAAADSASQLSRQLGNLLLETASEGAETALRLGSQLSQAAAGFLDGIAGSLKQREARKDKQD